MPDTRCERRGLVSGLLVARVAAIVADALDQPPERVHLHSSLIDDLGAESIDFLDIVFRLESTFGIKIPEEDLWSGSVGATADPAIIAERIVELRQRMPAFAWDRMPAAIGREHLPRLITVQTIVDYLERRGIDQGGEF